MGDVAQKFELGWGESEEEKQAGRQRARRMLQRIERQKGVELLMRDEDGWWYTTDAILRDRAPELYSKTDRATEVIREQFEGYEEEIETLRRQNKELRSRIKRLEISVSRIESLQNASGRVELRTVG